MMEIFFSMCNCFLNVFLNVFVCLWRVGEAFCDLFGVGPGVGKVLLINSMGGRG